MYIWWSDYESTEIKNCVYNYRIEVQHNGNTVFTSLTKDPSITIYKPDYCVKHTYIIFAENSKGISLPEFVTYDETKGKFLYLINLYEQNNKIFCKLKKFKFLHLYNVELL